MDNNTPNTDNFLNWVEIKNFKSIKDLTLKPCKRVNVFIGKPNVGKSNILEGLGLLGANLDHKKYLNGAVRYDSLIDLFYDHDSSHEIEIVTDKVSSTIKDKSISTIQNTYELTWKAKATYNRKFNLSEQGENFGSYEGLYTPGEKDSEYQNSFIRKYDFEKLPAFKNTFSGYLLPPHGWNLYTIIDRNPDIWKEFAELFREQNLEFVLLEKEQTFALQKKEGPRIKLFSFFSIADTFRRFMFYITAIESNKNSVIIFEEPEVHSFPPYTQDIAYRMIYSEENQFFVSTHSPYLLQTLVSNLKDDQLNVFVTYYEDFQTKVKALTPEELSFVQEYSTDVFFNLDRFVPNAQPANPA
jgi:AAA15 family ATPase/GTPase